MNVLGIVPARAGSKRILRKNLRPLLGRPLVAWALEAALAAQRLSRVVVSSDDPEVLALASNYAAGIPLARPAAIAGDTSPAIEYVRHAVDVLEAGGATRFDAVAIVQPSSPLTSAADIDATVALLESSGADSAVSVMRVDHALHPTKFKVMAGDRLLPYLMEEAGRMAAHQLPEVFVRNCSVYAASRRSLDRGQIIGADCRGYVMPRERSIDVNEEIDLLFAEFLITREYQP